MLSEFNEVACNLVVINTLEFLKNGLEECVATDHGHKKSNGESHISVKLVRASSGVPDFKDGGVEQDQQKDCKNETGEMINGPNASRDARVGEHVPAAEIPAQDSGVEQDEREDSEDEAGKMAYEHEAMRGEDDAGACVRRRSAIQARIAELRRVQAWRPALEMLAEFDNEVGAALADDTSAEAGSWGALRAAGFSKDIVYDWCCDRFCGGTKDPRGKRMAFIRAVMAVQDFFYGK